MLPLKSGVRRAQDRARIVGARLVTQGQREPQRSAFVVTDKVVLLVH